MPGVDISTSSDSAGLGKSQWFMWRHLSTGVKWADLVCLDVYIGRTVGGHKHITVSPGSDWDRPCQNWESRLGMLNTRARESLLYHVGSSCSCTCGRYLFVLLQVLKLIIVPHLEITINIKYFHLMRRFQSFLYWDSKQRTARHFWDENGTLNLVCVPSQCRLASPHWYQISVTVKLNLFCSSI